MYMYMMCDLKICWDDRFCFYSNEDYIIGGWTADPSTGYKTPIISEYKNGPWFNVGSLKQSRHAHGAITSSSLTMVIGGESTDYKP